MAEEDVSDCQEPTSVGAVASVSPVSVMSRRRSDPVRGWQSVPMRILPAPEEVEVDMTGEKAECIAIGMSGPRFNVLKSMPGT